jgi:hypothetical protein
MPLSEAGAAVESLWRLLEGIGYTGLFDAEFVYDDRDGLFKILEVNGRPWWQLELAMACGLDLTAMAYRDALGLRLAPAPDYFLGRTWVHPIPDLKAWWALARRRDGEVVGGFPVGAWFRGANALFTRDDPGPLAEEVARVARRLVPGWARPSPGRVRPMRAAPGERLAALVQRRPPCSPGCARSSPTRTSVATLALFVASQPVAPTPPTPSSAQTSWTAR